MSAYYTMKVHAERVLDMLEKLDEPCSDNTCPARHNYFIEPHGVSRDFWPNNPCPICRKFSKTKDGCPCIVLGKEETVKRAWLKLEKMGYI